ncbi:MAG TPA: flagellar protein FlgN [Desulfobulbaceae bacterium]|nr:flagellar protein FlgN [Desulfobulbaceae bacterium]
MTREAVRNLLQQLRSIILSEREHAKALDIMAMATDMQEKEALLQVIGKFDNLHPDDRPLAREIQQENLRNAYLFKATLNWIQDTMEFFGRKSVPTTYGQHGTTTNNCVNGRLLSGRV